MEIDSKDYRVKPGAMVKLQKRATLSSPCYHSEDDYQKMIKGHHQEMCAQQSLMYAHGRYSVLLIIQGMDASGKDCVIQHIMSGLNPQGCRVTSFKQPTFEELEHDFLWRSTKQLPERGMLGIFNRSYYEEVLVARVHPVILVRQGLPVELLDENQIWDGRFESILDFEAHLHRSGTRIIKVYLHLSQEEQTKRLLTRLGDPELNWKFNQDDIEERKLWKQYRKAYEACLSTTSTKTAPWFIVPADDKRNACLILSRIILDTFKSLIMSYPETTIIRQKELESIKAELLK